MISQSTVSIEIRDMAAEDDPHFMYILNFNYGYIAVLLVITETLPEGISFRL